jgi:hypothetical protein
MPKITLLLGRKTMQVYDLNQASIRVGREEDMDILIDNPSVSRRQTEMRKEGDGWVVEDLGSSNGTFLHGQKIDGAQPIVAGDEIGFGKFSVVFDKVVGDEPAVAGQSHSQPAMGGVEGTMHIQAHEVKELLKDSERKRRAHVAWESGGQRGTHYLSESPAALFGTDALCDVRVPKAPKHHILVINRDNGCEVRNLNNWSKMKVNGSAQNPATLKDGDVVQVGGLKLTFVADIA